MNVWISAVVIGSISAAALCLGLTGLAGGAEAGPERASSPRTNSAVRLVAQGAFSGVQEAQQLVITNRSDWEALWQRHASRRQPAEPVPAIDFGKESVLFIGLGRKNTGGYGVSTPVLAVKAGRTIARVGVKSPPPNSMNLQAITAPFCIVAIPATNTPSAFELFDEPHPAPKPRREPRSTPKPVPAPN